MKTPMIFSFNSVNNQLIFRTHSMTTRISRIRAGLHKKEIKGIVPKNMMATIALSRARSTNQTMRLLRYIEVCGVLKSHSG